MTKILSTLQNAVADINRASRALADARGPMQDPRNDARAYRPF